MRKRKKLTLVFLSVLMMLGLMTGCSGKGEPDKEAIFTKTIHDFDQLRVDNLDQQEDTNFIVYAEDVQEIVMTDEVNVLTQRDDENLVYQFSNADDALLAMEAGDVFWGVTERCESVCVKVSSLQADGTSVVIQGEEMSLSDLFTYADICMDIDCSEFYVDPSQIPEDCTVEYTGMSAGAGQTGGIVLLSASSPGSGTVASASAKVDVPVGLTLSTKMNIQKAAVTVESEWRATIRSVTVEFRYSDGVFFSSLVVNGTESCDLSITGEGALVDIEKALAGVTVPVGGPILGQVIPYSVFSVSGELEVGISSDQDLSEGFAVTAGAKSGLSFSAIQQNSAPVVTPRLEELSGKIKAGIKFKVGISCLKLADIYGTAQGGIELEGSYDLFEAEKDRGKDSVHDCKACIAGEANLVARVTAGAELCMLPGNRLYQSELTLMEFSQKLCDFYISYGASGGNEFEFGWAKTCPHRRYLVTVTVLSEDGDPASGAAVTAHYPDGRTESASADGAGQAEFYLPVGEGSITATRAGQKGSVSVMVTDQPPITALMRLEAAEQQVYIIYSLDESYDDDDGNDIVCYHDISDYPELESVFLEMFPDAVLANGESNYGRLSPTSKLAELFGTELNPGDIVIYADASNAYYLYANEYSYTGSNPYSHLSSKLLTAASKNFVGLRLQVNIALEITPEQTEQYGIRENDGVILACMYSLVSCYDVDSPLWNTECSHASEPHICYFPCEREWIGEAVWAVTAGGILFDENYRVTGKEEVVNYEWEGELDSGLSHEWVYDVWTDPQIPYVIAQRARGIYPYVSLLQEGDYFEKAAELAGGDNGN